MENWLCSSLSFAPCDKMIIMLWLLVTILLFFFFKACCFFLPTAEGLIDGSSYSDACIGLRLYRFDSLRVTPRSLDILAKGPPVCGDLAVSLSQAGPQFTQVSLICAHNHPFVLFCLI